MAIVANKSDASFGTDKSWCSPNRSNAGDPNGALTPQFVGELVEDTTNKKVWEAMTALNTGWVTYNVGPRTA
jgi:hypothetical protein